jgi:hypothetical protein
MTGNNIEFDTSDPEAMAALFEKLQGEDQKTEQKVEPENKETVVEPTVEPVPDSATQKTEQEPPEPDGITTKDGKHVIPYSVLKSERDRASRAEQIAAEMQERVTALEAMAKAGNQGANNGESARTTPDIPDASELSNDDLESLKEDFPTVYKAVMASMAYAKALEAKIQPVEASVREDAAERARNATDMVQDAIDSVPKMAHLQATDAQAFNLAKQFDATLRTQPSWADKSLAERFAKVVDMVESTLGTINVPGTKPAPQISTEDLKSAAVAKAAAAVKAARSNVPNSLSEVPGEAAAEDEREAAENMSALQLAEKFSSMSPDQMDAYFRTL